jgi:hypothetical protein
MKSGPRDIAGRRIDVVELECPGRLSHSPHSDESPQLASDDIATLILDAQVAVDHFPIAFVGDEFEIAEGLLRVAADRVKRARATLVRLREAQT